MTVEDITSMPTRRRALVLGGTGTVGRAVLAELARAHVPTAFTYLSSADRARALAETGERRALALDLADLDAVRALAAAFIDADEVPDVVIDCAAVAAPDAVEDITDELWTRAQRINCQAPFVLCQALAPRWRASGHADVVLVGALDRAQSLPLPVAFAATQGMLSGLTMALAKQLGANGIRVNMVALGLLGEGLSLKVGQHLYEDFHRFSALRRSGTAAEAARFIAWLALHNQYMNGKVVPVNGGI